VTALQGDAVQDKRIQTQIQAGENAPGQTELHATEPEIQAVYMVIIVFSFR